jgi:hypothetical protein
LSAQSTTELEFYVGSTAFPKPIRWTNLRSIQGALIPWFGERDLTDQILSLHSMPMYHGMLQLAFVRKLSLKLVFNLTGMGILQTFWSVSSCSSTTIISSDLFKAACGLVLSAFEPKSPPTIPTPENHFRAAKATGSDIIFCVPSFIEVCFFAI